jgi:hypothetical protein
MVADGDPHPMVAKWKDIEHITLSQCHHDAGATPRAIGAISAFSRGFDAVAFLDADNHYNADHIETMVNLLAHNDVVTATRNICNSTGELLYIDTVESNGNQFCDTNCMFLTKNLLHLMTSWITGPNRFLWSDRYFWNAVLEGNFSRVHSVKPTVNYYTRWAWHYQYAGQDPPLDSVWIAKTTDGSLIHEKHKDTVNYHGLKHRGFLLHL